MFIKLRNLILFVWLSALLVLLAAIAAGVIYANAKGPLAAEKDVIIERGSSVVMTTKALHQNGIIKHPELFIAVAVTTGKYRKFKAGEYGFASAATPLEVMEKLVKGEVKIHSLTLPEGLSTFQALQIINSHPVLAGTLALKPKEGELLPETYFFSRGYTRNELVERMMAMRSKNLLDAWQNRNSEIPLKTSQEALILASIVEKETSMKDEMPRVAGVFYNRINKGMPLQSDPTALYVVSNKTGVLDRPLTKKDLEVASPYNTYYVKGLPPAPITNPGKRAVEAVLNPSKTSDFYFVADGTGGHKFSETLAEHNKAVAEYRSFLKKQDSAR